MSRTNVIAVRYFALAVGLVLTGIYLAAVMPHDQNIIDTKICTVAFVCTYSAMTASLVIFARVRKFDIALICWALFSVAVSSHLGFSYIEHRSMPYLSELMSGIGGILASLLPVCIAKIRSDARESHNNLRYIAMRRMITPTTPLIGH